MTKFCTEKACVSHSRNKLYWHLKVYPEIEKLNTPSSVAFWNCWWAWNMWAVIVYIYMCILQHPDHQSLRSLWPGHLSHFPVTNSSWKSFFKRKQEHRNNENPLFKYNSYASTFANVEKEHRCKYYWKSEKLVGFLAVGRRLCTLGQKATTNANKKKFTNKIRIDRMCARWLVYWLLVV